MKLKELSRHLGLSPTTVSRALNGYPEVSERTRQRVLDAAQRHGYSPNSGAKRLAEGRAMTIGHLLPVSKEHEMVNPVFSDFIAGAGKRYAEEGYDLMLSVVRDEDESATYRDLAKRGAVDGVVIHGPRSNDRRIPLLTELGLPFVVHGRSSAVGEDYNWVDVNNRRAFERATSLLLDLGHTRIAFLNGMSDMDFAARRLSGMRDAFLSRGLTIDEALICHSEMSENYGYSRMRDFLALPNPPTAVLVSSIIPAIGIRRALNDAGLSMPGDISVLIHDDNLSYFRNEGDVPIFTATRSSVREAGHLTADLLLQAIRAPGAGPHRVLLEAELTIGQSTGPAPAMRRFLKQG